MMAMMMMMSTSYRAHDIIGSTAQGHDVASPNSRVMRLVWILCRFSFDFDLNDPRIDLLFCFIPIFIYWNILKNTLVSKT
jgi:hypothetical protein